MLLILRIVLAIYPHKCTKVAIFALPKKQPDMNILNNEGWNVVILENNFNSILNVIGDYPLHIEKGGLFISNNEKDSGSEFQMDQKRVLNTEINVTLIGSYIDDNTHNAF